MADSNYEIIVISDEEIEQVEQKKKKVAVIEDDDEAYVPELDESSSTASCNDSEDEAFFPENPWEWWQHVSDEDEASVPCRKTVFKKINAKSMPISKATTTPVINCVFQDCFKDYMDKSIPQIPSLNETRTCGSCIYCQNNIHFNGVPVCLKEGKELVKGDDETIDDIGEDEEIKILEITKSNISSSAVACTSFVPTESEGFAWINESVSKFGNKIIYDRVQAEDGILKVGDFVYFPAAHFV